LPPKFFPAIFLKPSKLHKSEQLPKPPKKYPTAAGLKARVHFAKISLSSFTSEYINKLLLFKGVIGYNSHYADYRWSQKGSQTEQKKISSKFKEETRIEKFD